MLNNCVTLGGLSCYISRPHLREGKIEGKGIENARTQQKQMMMKIVQKISLLIVFLMVVGTQNSQAQTQACNRNSWEWMGHNHWFLPTWMPNDGRSVVVNQRTGQELSVQQSPYVDQWSTSMGGYQGIAAASNDNGDLVFFTNGRKAWKADGTLITDQIKQGNECGSIEHGGSAVHGTMIVRHPLQPNRYYIITIDDIVNQGNITEGNQNGTCGNGITVAAIDSSGGLVHASQSIETNIATGKQGLMRTTEGFAATFHGNGVDIWITFQPLFKDYFVSYLLTCDGFVTAPVISGECTAIHSVLFGYGDLDFSPDGSMLATACQVDQGDARNAPEYGWGALNLYDFDNWTGTISNRKAVWKSQWGSMITTNVLFSADGSEVHYSGFSNSGKIPTTGTEAQIRNAHSNTSFLSNGFSAAAMNYQGVIEQRSTTNNKYASAGKHGNELGSNDMYIPPLEEPDITEVGPFCDTTSTIDLETVWMCSGVNAELAIRQADATHGYFGNGIVATDSGQIKGLFDPRIAGVGTHMIEFKFCGVDDTIWIDVVACATCIDTLSNTTPELCIGNTLNLDALVDTANGPGVWTIDSVPASASVDASIDDSGVDTLFDATNMATKFGTYKAIYTVTKDAQTCKDSIYITVNALPVISVNDSAICADGFDALFTATSDSAVTSYLWGDNGTGTAQTTTGSTAGNYSVEVTDVNGCVGRDTGLLTINAIPVISVNDSTICAGGAAAEFTATSDSTAVNYLWGENGSGTAQTTQGTTAGNYSVIVIDNNGCVGRDTGVLSINAVPIIQVNDSTICAGDPDALFTATSDSTAASYLWSGNGTGTAQTSGGSTAGEYIVEVTDVNGCVGSDTGMLVVNALPVVTVNDSIICAGNPDAVFTASSDSTAVSYVWSDNGSGTDPTTQGTVIGDYTATVTDVNGCVGSGTGRLIVTALPVVSVSNEEICVGGAAATFTVTSDSTVASYAWSGNGTGTDPTTTGTTAGDYTVSIIDLNGCAGTATGTLTVHDLPVVTLDGGNICPTTMFTLSPVVTTNNGPSTYSWDTGETTPTVNKGAGTYTVTVTDAKGCVGSDDATVIEDPNLTPVINGPISICDGEDTLLISNYKAADGYSFAWSLGATPTGDVTESITVSTSGTYGLYVNRGACQGATTVDVTVNARPTVTVADQAICDGVAAATFTAVSPSATSYLWSENGLGIDVTTLGNVAGNYTVEVTDANGCKDTATAVLTVNSLPTVTVNNAEICAGDPAATFTATSATATGWTWADNGSGTDQTTTGTTAGTYSVTVTDANGCVGIGAGSLTVNALPVPVVDDQAICDGDAGATFTATADSALVSFIWSGNGTGTARTTTGTTAGVYTVDVTDENGCVGSASGSLTVNPLPIVGNDPGVLCEGSQGAVIGEVVTGGTYTYFWPHSGETTASISVSYGNSTFGRTVTNTATGCEATSSYWVTQNPTPILSLVDQTECEGTQITLQDAAGETGYVYTWTGGVSTTGSYQPTASGTWEVTKAYANTGCSVTATVSATYIPIPNLQINVNDTVYLCAGEQLEINAVHDATDVLWNTGETSDEIIVDSHTSYSVQASNGSCISYDTMYVRVTDYPVSQLDKTASLNPICFETLDSVLTLTAHQDQSLNFMWNTGETTPTIEAMQEGTYDVEISTNAGPNGKTCPIVDQVTLSEFCPWSFHIPNAFTPDGDGLNDVFYGYGMQLMNYELRVYDRWGLLVWKGTDINEGWDGKYQGNEAQMDVYVWKVNFDVETLGGNVDKVARVGTVTLVR